VALGCFDDQEPEETLTFSLATDVDVEFEAEVGGRAVDGEITLSDGDYEVEVDADDYSHSRCSVSVIEGIGTVTFSNYPPWAEANGRPETTTAELRDGEVLTIPMVATPYNLRSYNCVDGPRQIEPPPVLQTNSGQRVYGWHEFVVIEPTEEVPEMHFFADYETGVIVDLAVSDDYTHLEGTRVSITGAEYPVVCDMR
jgi:hypothetical protein